MLRFLPLLLLLHSLALFADPRLDSMVRALERVHGRDRIVLLSDIGWEYSFQDSAKALFYARQAVAQAQQAGDMKLLAQCWSDMSATYIRTGVLDKGGQCLQEALKANSQVTEPRQRAAILSKMGVIAEQEGSLEQAVRLNLEALTLFEQVGDKPAAGVQLSNIGSTYAKLNRQSQARQYFLRSLKITRELHDNRTTGNTLGNLGQLYLRLNKPDSALFFMNEAINLFRKIDDKTNLGIALATVGGIYARKGQHAKRLEISLESLRLSQEMNDQVQETYGLANVGNALLDLKRPTEAEAYYRQALAIAERTQQKTLRRLAYQGMARWHHTMGNGPAAYDFMVKYSAIKDSIYNEESARQIAEMEARFETAKKQQEIVSQQLTITQQESRLTNQRYGMVALAGLLILLALGGALWVQRIRARQRADLDAAIIRQQELNLQAVILAQEDERKRIAKDLHDGIAQQLGGLKLAWQRLSRDIAHKTPDENAHLQQLTAVLDASCDEVRTLSHRMMPRALAELGLVPALDDMLHKSLGNSDIQFSFDHFGPAENADQRLPEHIEIAVFRIAQELINNVMKHAHASEVSLQLIHQPHQLLLVVEDNGRGMAESAKTDGIGMANIRSRTSTLGGEFTCEPSPEKGLVCTIKIPLQ